MGEQHFGAIRIQHPRGTSDMTYRQRALEAIGLLLHKRREASDHIRLLWMPEGIFPDLGDERLAVHARNLAGKLRKGKAGVGFRKQDEKPT